MLKANFRSPFTNQCGNYAGLIRISGTVHFPGDYPLTDGMSLYDLFNAGGGTKDSAYMLDAEVTRMVVGSEQVASVSHIRLDRNLLSDSNASKTFKLHLMMFFR